MPALVRNTLGQPARRLFLQQQGTECVCKQAACMACPPACSNAGKHGSQQYSVLIRGQVGTPASDPEGTQELYR